MGKHTTPEGEKSTSEKMTGTRNQEHTPQHAAIETTKSDVPPRGNGVKEVGNK